MTDRFRRTPSNVEGTFRGLTACAAVPAMLLFAAAANAASSLPRSGANPERLAVPDAPLAAEAPPASALPESVVEATRLDLLKRLGEAARGVKPELAVRESVVWPDGGLGCPDPGAKYTMAPVPGWRLVWRAAGRDWEYHAGQRGSFVYCPPPNARDRTPARRTAPVPAPTPRLPAK